MCPTILVLKKNTGNHSSSVYCPKVSSDATHAMSVLYAATSASKPGSTSSDTGAFFEITWEMFSQRKM